MQEMMMEDENLLSSYQVYSQVKEKNRFSCK